jgi:hypothetical protein
MAVTLIGHARVPKIISDGNEKHVVLKNQYCILRASIFFGALFLYEGRGTFHEKYPFPRAPIPEKFCLWL